jgi:hypothetical protein
MESTAKLASAQRRSMLSQMSTASSASSTTTTAGVRSMNAMWKKWKIIDRVNIFGDSQKKKNKFYYFNCEQFPIILFFCRP